MRSESVAIRPPRWKLLLALLVLTARSSRLQGHGANHFRAQASAGCASDLNESLGSTNTTPTYCRDLRRGVCTCDA